MNQLAQTVGKPGCKVLIADDNRDCAESCAMLLGIQGYQCRVAGDGQEALEAFAKFSPDVVILDIAMPRLDGNDVARRIRESGAEVTLIAISGWARESDRHRCYAAGFDFYLQKPAEPEEVARLLNERRGSETPANPTRASADDTQQ